MDNQQDDISAALSGASGKPAGTPGDAPNPSGTQGQKSDRHASQDGKGDHGTDGGGGKSAANSKTIIVVVVGAAVVILALVTVGMFSKGQEQRTMTTSIEPHLDAPRDAMADFAAFSKRTRQEMNELRSGQKRNDENIAQLLKKQDETDERVRATLQNGMEDIKRLIAEAKASGAARPQGSTSPERGTDQNNVPSIQLDPEMQRLAQVANRDEVRRALSDFRDNLVSLSVDPKKNRSNTVARMRAVNVPENDIRNLMAAEAQKAGRYYIGDISEEYAKMDEMAKQLPEEAVRIMPDLVQHVAGLGEAEGKVLPAQTRADVERFVKARVTFTPAEKIVMQKAVIDKMTVLARVRRQNLSDEEQDYIPFLLEKKRQAGVASEDRVALAKMVWSLRDSLPPDLTGGKILSLVQILSREVNNTENPAAKAAAGLPDTPTGWSSLTKENAEVAIKATTAAVSNAYNMGRTSQPELMEFGLRALKSHLEAAKVTATEEQRSRMVLEAIMRNSQSQASPQPVPASTPGSVPTPLSPRSQQEPGRTPRPGTTQSPGDEAAPFPAMAFGPLALTPSDLAITIFWMTPNVLEAASLDAGTASGAAAAVATYEQMQRLSDQLSLSANGMRDIQLFRNGVLPQVVGLMRGMRPLSALDVPMSSDSSINASHDASVFRGVVLGSIYGPYMHDEATAKTVGAQALDDLEQHPPFSDVIRARMAKISDTRPWERMIAAYQAYRPGRITYPPARYQDMVLAIDQRTKSTKAIVDAMTPAFATDKDESLARFTETLRVFVPASVAVREDGKLTIEQVMSLVDRDIRDYAVSFTAESIAVKQIMEQIVPMYAFSVAEEYGGPAALVAIVGKEVPSRISRVMRDRHPASDLPSLVDTAQQVAAVVVGEAEGFIAKEVVLSRVIPRISRQGKLAGPQAIADASAHARKRVDEVIKSPFTPQRIDAWSQQITKEATAILEGRKADTATNTAQSSSVTQTGPVAFPPARAIGSKSSGPSGTSNLIGVSTLMVRSRKVVIPAGSYGNAHIVSGASVELGATGQNNVPVLVNLNYNWNGPNGSHLTMRNLRLLGAATPKKGPHRVSIAIKSLSYVFPSGRSLFQDCDGFVVDNIEGKEGAIGEWNWNLSTVLPLALASGGAAGASKALTTQTSSTIVSGVTGTTTTVPTTDTLQTALYGGLAGGFDQINGFVQDVLKDTKVSIEVPNGQRITVVLSKPVVLDVPEEEFSNLTSPAAGSFAGM